MIEPRSIDDIQQEYFEAITNSGSGLLIDKSEGSLAYTLSRATATVISGLDERLVENTKNSNLLNATGDVLDSIGNSFLEREREVKAFGFVLAQPDSEVITLPFDTRLFTLDEGVSYRVMDTPSISLLPYNLTPIKVEAVNVGSLGNKVAGTPMFSPDWPNVSFVVGSQQRGSQIFGDIAGGRDLETDQSYRRRIISFLTQGPYSSTQYIENKLLQYPYVERAFVNTPAPGVCEIWVDTPSIYYNESQIRELYNYISPYLSLGVIPFISQARRRPIDISLDITPFMAGTVSFDNLSSQISEVVKSFIQRLNVGQTLLKSELYSVLRPLVNSLTIREPSTDVYVDLNELIVTGLIRVNYPVSNL